MCVLLAIVQVLSLLFYIAELFNISNTFVFLFKTYSNCFWNMLQSFWAYFLFVLRYMLLIAFKHSLYAMIVFIFCLNHIVCGILVHVLDNRMIFISIITMCKPILCRRGALEAWCSRWLFHQHITASTICSTIGLWAFRWLLQQSHGRWMRWCLKLPRKYHLEQTKWLLKNN